MVVGSDGALVDIDAVQADTLKHWTSVLTWTSFALNSVVVAVNLADARKRRFPARLTTNFAAAALLFNFALGLGTFVDYQQIPDPFTGRPARFVVLCKIQAALIHYLANALSAWWLCISVTLHQIICRGRDFGQLQVWERSLHAFCWGFPVLLTLVPLAAGELGPVAGCAWCQVRTSHYSLYLMTCFYFWMGSYMVVGGWCGLCTVRTLRDLQARTVVAPVALSREYSYIIQRQIYSVAIFFVVFAINLAWGATFAYSQTHRTVVPYWVCVVAMVAVTSPGFDCFVLFGLTRSTLRFLRHLLLPCVAARTPLMSPLLYQQRTYSSGRSPHGAGSSKSPPPSSGGGGGGGVGGGGRGAASAGEALPASQASSEEHGPPGGGSSSSTRGMALLGPRTGAAAPFARPARPGGSRSAANAPAPTRLAAGPVPVLRAAPVGYESDGDDDPDAPFGQDESRPATGRSGPRADRAGLTPRGAMVLGGTAAQVRPGQSTPGAGRSLDAAGAHQQAAWEALQVPEASRPRGDSDGSNSLQGDTFDDHVLHGMEAGAGMYAAGEGGARRGGDSGDEDDYEEGSEYTGSAAVASL